jgi:DNA invertase Pin-like site-specific DNA recombinase
MLLGYARVSKGEVQETALRTTGVEQLRTERTSGGRWDRSALLWMPNQLRPGDVVVVWVVV